MLTKSWPTFETAYVDSRQMPYLSVEAIVDAVNWLSDGGFIIYEAVIRDGLVVILRDAALTPRGREFLASFPPHWQPEGMRRAA